MISRPDPDRPGWFITTPIYTGTPEMIVWAQNCPHSFLEVARTIEGDQEVIVETCEHCGAAHRSRHGPAGPQTPEDPTTNKEEESC